MKVGILTSTQGKEAILSKRTAEFILSECSELEDYEFEIITVSDLISKKVSPDVVINIHYGLLGDGGAVPGLLDLMGLPYTGSGVLASSIGRNKIITKYIGQQAGINFSSHLTVNPQDEQIALDTIISQLGLPVIIKPVDSASSIDVLYANSEQELKDVFSKLKTYNLVMVEPFHQGQEVTVGVLEKDGERLGLPVIGLEIKHQPYQNFQAKYGENEMEFVIPAKLNQTTSERVQEIATSLHRAVGCRGYSRTDMIIKASGEIVVLEINTFPGIGPYSEFPKAARLSGISYQQLITSLIQTALCGYDISRSLA
ncbi:MAG: ATP-grasp domain-containing protein [Patescibacteria group bacterium]